MDKIWYRNPSKS